jgi:glycosyltransferase involved in cell wall biosynthesis
MTTATDGRPLVTIVLPAFNEAAILGDGFRAIEEHLRTLAARYRFEILVVNDGSTDGTGDIAEKLASGRDDVTVVHHAANFGLGRAFRTAFEHCRGDYVVTLDVDLSYEPRHIGLLLEKLRESRAQVVLASPYMKGGRISNVPWLRRTLSIWANRFLSLFAPGRLSTLTCMVRAYDGEFIRSLVLRATGMEIMPETVYKTMIMRGRIAQVPAHLDWSRQLAAGQKRRSSMRIWRQMIGTLLSGFIFRPFMFFILPGLLLLAFSLWTSAWMVVHFFDAWQAIGPIAGDRVSAAVAQAYRDYPHTFIVGLLSLMLAIQLIGLGILALQAKNYFEEIFNLGSRAGHHPPPEA